MEWQKRDCPVRMKILPVGSGWTHVKLDIGGDHHLFRVSGVMGNNISTLVSCLFALYPEQVYCERERSQLDTFTFTYDKTKDREPLNFRLTEKSSKGSYYELPYRACVYWDGEGSCVQWTIIKPKSLDCEFEVAVDLEVGDDNGGCRYHYEVSYQDMCYAVGKALTEAVKHSGFGGFSDSVWNCDVNVRHLCFLKACGMGNPHAVAPRELVGDMGSVSSFENELQLLQLDM